MTTRPNPVSSVLQLRLVVPGSAALPVRAGLDYDPSDPYAVTVSFHTTGGAGGSDVVSWTFARQLLADGLAAPAGEGDVQVWPSSGALAPVVCLSLSSPSGRALFELPLAELAQFLAETYEVVPSGAESALVDVEGELALLLWAEPET